MYGRRLYIRLATSCRVVYKLGSDPRVKMRWSDVVRSFTQCQWTCRDGTRYMYIYERGTLTALPGVPSEWYKSFIPWVRRGCVTCTYGIDWWCEERRVRVENEVEHGILFSMDDVFYQHVRSNWASMGVARLRNVSLRTPMPKNPSSDPGRVSCSRDAVSLREVF